MNDLNNELNDFAINIDKYYDCLVKKTPIYFYDKLYNQYLYFKNKIIDDKLYNAYCDYLCDILENNKTFSRKLKLKRIIKNEIGTE